MDADSFRLHWGGAIIITAMVAMLVALLIILGVGTDRDVPTTLALIGGITTFLSAVVGVFFGVSASGGAAAQGAAAVAAAGQAAAASSDAAAAAHEVAASARQVSLSAARALDQVQMRSGDAFPPGPAGADDLEETVEVLRFDPGAPATTLAMPRGLDRLFGRIFTPQHETDAVPGPASGFALFQRTIKVAQAEAAAGISRSSNRSRVTEYLALLGFGFADAGGKPVPFCAAGLTWATCRAICDATGIAYTDANRLAVFRGVLGEVGRFFKPSASCKAILDDARARGTLVSQPMPGYLVLYNWSGGSHPEHVGLVVGATDTILSTVEFNTSAAGSQSDGGAVAEKNRNRKYAIGYVRTYPDNPKRALEPAALADKQVVPQPPSI